jgi:uncharacterized membrane protein YdjX (TVP38/TMEM64 family)/Fe-S oxidoreductase
LTGAVFEQKKADMKERLTVVSSMENVVRGNLRKELDLHSEKCIECKLCRKECLFLQKYGSPKRIADSFNPASPKDRLMPYECSLCGLCAVVCPVGINPAHMFLEMRRAAVSAGNGDLPEHASILAYERRGTSKRYSYYALPEGCKTVLFPGCTLPGTRPDKVKKLFDHLRQSVPDLGIVLDCCTKPSHDLGRENHFHAMFNDMKGYLLDHGVEEVLVACPNCYRVFKQYGGPLAVRTVYECLAENNPPDTETVAARITIHDPCSTRDEEHIHAAIRALAGAKKLDIEEMKHHGRKTLCCGEGGSVGCLNPDFSKNWGKRRGEEAGGLRVLTYCAGCANFLDKITPASHILDLLFEPRAALAGKARVAKAPWTYLNRILLKNHFKKSIKPGACRERTLGGKNKAKGGMAKRLALLFLVIGAILAIRLSGATAYLEQVKLRELIAGYGASAPAVYMLVYAIAPALFLPGLPLTIAGGILFGPFWGVIYTISGATMGASIAFLVARYVGREWIEGKLKSPRWRQLDTMVEEHGWKAVAFTRLLPIFPFNLLNYAFGLTRIKFSHYALASFFCMLPACIAFIVFSSSLLEVVRGSVTPSFVIGAVLIVAVALIPFFYKKYKAFNKKS